MTRHFIAFTILSLIAAGPAGATDGPPGRGRSQGAPPAPTPSLDGPPAPASTPSLDCRSSPSTQDTVPARLLASETVMVVAPAPPVRAIAPAAKGLRSKLNNTFWLFVAARVASE